MRPPLPIHLSFGSIGQPHIAHLFLYIWAISVQRIGLVCVDGLDLNSMYLFRLCFLCVSRRFNPGVYSMDSHLLLVLFLFKDSWRFRYCVCSARQHASHRQPWCTYMDRVPCLAVLISIYSSCGFRSSCKSALDGLGSPMGPGRGYPPTGQLPVPIINKQCFLLACLAGFQPVSFHCVAAVMRRLQIVPVLGGCAGRRIAELAPS